jgi:hypothetical protein
LRFGSSVGSAAGAAPIFAIFLRSFSVGYAVTSSLMAALASGRLKMALCIQL